MFIEVRIIFISNCYSFKTDIMKTEIIKIATFACMVVVLGLQTLLQGSWKVPKTQAVQTGKDRNV